MSDESCRARLRDFLAGVVADDLGDDDDLFELGHVSSLFALELVSFVESEFALAIENEDLELDNFRSIAAIESLVVRKAGGARVREPARP